MKKECPKCGFEISDDMTECPQCGIVFDKYKKIKKKNYRKSSFIFNNSFFKKILNIKISDSIIFGFSIFILFGTIFYISYDHFKTKEEVLIEKPKKNLKHKQVFAEHKKVIQQKQRKTIKNKREYYNAINLIKSKIVLEETTCLMLCELTISKWQQAIENGESFNLVLLSLHNSLLKNGTIESLKENKREIEKELKLLNGSKDFNPTVKEKLIDLYGIYSQILSLAIGPNGSLLTYSNRVRNLQDNFINTLNKLTVLIPEQE